MLMRDWLCAHCYPCNVSAAEQLLFPCMAAAVSVLIAFFVLFHQVFRDSSE